MSQGFLVEIRAVFKNKKTILKETKGDSSLKRAQERETFGLVAHGVSPRTSFLSISGSHLSFSIQNPFPSCTALKLLFKNFLPP